MAGAVLPHHAQGRRDKEVVEEVEDRAGAADGGAPRDLRQIVHEGADRVDHDHDGLEEDDPDQGEGHVMVNQVDDMAGKRR